MYFAIYDIVKVVFLDSMFGSNMRNDLEKVLCKIRIPE